MCADKCLISFREDDLTCLEMICLVNCYSKHYRFFAYANTLYSYLASDEKVDEHLHDKFDDFVGLEPDQEERDQQTYKAGGEPTSTQWYADIREHHAQLATCRRTQSGSTRSGDSAGGSHEGRILSGS